MSEDERTRQGSAGTAGAEETLRAWDRILRAAYPAADPSPALRRRVTEMARRHEAIFARRLWWRRWARLGVALAATAAMLAVGMALGPTLVAAAALRRMEAAVSDARSAHIAQWRAAPDGTRARDDTWYQDGRWRIEDARSIQVFAEGKLWTYRPKSNRVTIARRAGPFSYTPSGFGLGAMARDFARWGWRDRIRALGERNVQGRRLREVVIERAAEPARLRFWVDASTDLPVRMAIEKEENGRWSLAGGGEFRFNQPLPARLFAPEFPPSARVVDVDAERQTWERQLAKGVASQRVGDRTIVLRDLQVNGEGDVFLLYTAGKYLGDSLRFGNYQAGRDWHLELEDEFGTKYVWQQGLQPTMARQPPGLPNGSVLNGERLEGDWWVSLAPQGPWKPRAFTLTFRVSPVNLHGNYEDPPVNASYTERARFVVPVASPATVLVPDYMPYMAMGLTEWDLLRGRAGARAHYYRYRAQDLPRALDYYRQEIAAGEAHAREIGEKVHMPQIWFDLYEVLRDLGRPQEARAALLRARDECIYRGNDATWQQIRRALETR